MNHIPFLQRFIPEGTHYDNVEKWIYAAWLDLVCHGGTLTQANRGICHIGIHTVRGIHYTTLDAITDFYASNRTSKLAKKLRTLKGRDEVLGILLEKADITHELSRLINGQEKE